MKVKLDPIKWREARKKCILRYKGKCALCGRRGTEVHHIRAKSVGGALYSQSNLKLLCKRCHKKIHKTYRPWEKKRKKRRFYSRGPIKRTGRIRVKVKAYKKKTHKVRVKRPSRRKKKT